MRSGSAERWRVLASEVSNLLHEYIAVHDTLIRQSGFRALFRKIDFDDLYERLSRVQELLNQRQNEIDTVRNAASLTEAETTFTSCLSQYTESLRMAVTLLKAILEDLIAKSSGRPLTMSQHKLNWQHYEEAIKTYTVLGNTLNALYRVLE